MIEFTYQKITGTYDPISGFCQWNNQGFRSIDAPSEMQGEINKAIKNTFAK